MDASNNHDGHMNDRITLLLNEIYGTADADRILTRYLALADGHMTKAGSRTDHLNSANCWLIAYPDHISGTDESPLELLRGFVANRLRPHVDGIHILPCFPSSSDEGFSVKNYTQIDRRYGTWEDIEAIGKDGNLMLDAVINHASSQGHWFESWRSGSEEFSRFFRTEDPESDLSAVVRARDHPLLTRFETASGDRWVWTTFSEDQVDLDYRNPEVMLAIAEVLLTYARYGAAAIRLDAIGFLWKEPGTPSIHLTNTHRIVQLLRATLDATYPSVLLVSETNVPHAENISYLGDRSQAEADMVYQFPLPPLTLHAFATGSASVLKDWLKTINDIPESTTYLNFLASHDGVGLRPLEGIVDPEDVKGVVEACVKNGALVTYRSDIDGASVPYELNGTWFDLIRGEESGEQALRRHIASHALMVALRGEPAIYMQALLAESNATDLAMGATHPRSMNRRRFTIDALDACLDDPTSVASISLAAILQLLSWRRETDAFHPAAPQRVLDTSEAVIGIERQGMTGTRVRVFVNVGDSREYVQTPHDGDGHGFGMTLTGGGIELEPFGIGWVTMPPSHHS